MRVDGGSVGVRLGPFARAPGSLVARAARDGPLACSISCGSASMAVAVLFVALMWKFGLLRRVLLHGAMRCSSCWRRDIIRLRLDFGAVTRGQRSYCSAGSASGMPFESLRHASLVVFVFFYLFSALHNGLARQLRCCDSNIRSSVVMFLAGWRCTRSGVFSGWTKFASTRASAEICMMWSCRVGRTRARIARAAVANLVSWFCGFRSVSLGVLGMCSCLAYPRTWRCSIRVTKDLPPVVGRVVATFCHVSTGRRRSNAL
jgi:hypothetical protein